MIFQPSHFFFIFTVGLDYILFLSNIKLFFNWIPTHPAMSRPFLLCMLHRNISRVENENGLCAYILYMHIAPFHSQP